MRSKLMSLMLGAPLALVAAALVLTGTAAAAPNMQDAKYETSQQDYENTRNLKYCEMFIFDDDAGTFDVYNSTDWDCPDDVWQNMDLDQVAADNGGNRAQQNGPQYWMCDQLSLFGSEPVDIGGVEMRWGVSFDQSVLGGDGGGAYAVFSPQKNQIMTYEAGKESYELVDPDGNVYSLQGRKADVSMDDLETLGDQLSLPDGWVYRVRVLDEDAVVTMTPDKQNPSVTDELDQTYVQIPDVSGRVTYSSADDGAASDDGADEAPAVMPTTGGGALPGGLSVLLIVALAALALGGALRERVRA